MRWTTSWQWMWQFWWDKLPKCHKLLKIIQGKKKNQSNTISIKDIKFVIMNFLHGKLQIVHEGILSNLSEILSAFEIEEILV